MSIPLSPLEPSVSHTSSSDKPAISNHSRCKLSAAISAAIFSRDETLLRSLLNKDNVNDMLCFGQTPLFLALRCSGTIHGSGIGSSVVTLLLSMGAQVNVWNCSVIGLRLHHDDQPEDEIRRFHLIRDEFSLLPREKKLGDIHRRVQQRNREASADPQLDKALSKARTPLMEAAETSQTSLFQSLLKTHHADYQVAAPDGRTAHSAATLHDIAMLVKPRRTAWEGAKNFGSNVLGEWFW